MGLVAWTGRPDSRTGALMVSLGFAWVARYVVAVAVHPAFVAGVLLGSVYLSILVHLLATFPDGRLHGPVERAVVVVGYLLSAPLDLFFLAVFSADRGLGKGPPPNGLVIAPTNGEFDPAGLDLVVQAVVVLLFLTLLAIVFGRWRTAGPALRRSLGPAVVGGAVIVLTILVERTAILLLIPPGLGVVFAWSAQVVLVLWPLALLIGLLRSQLDRSAVGRLVVELGAGVPGPARLQRVLARTLHDPSLELAFWRPEQSSFVDPGGAQVIVEPRDGRAVTYLDRDGERIAVLRHDKALTGEPELVAAVAASASLAVQNERLHDEVRNQLREVSASRARIVEAGDGAPGRRAPRRARPARRCPAAAGHRGAGAAAGAQPGRHRLCTGPDRAPGRGGRRAVRGAGGAARARPRHLPGAADRRGARSGARLPRGAGADRGHARRRAGSALGRPDRADLLLRGLRGAGQHGQARGRCDGGHRRPR